ncbi:unnamed protein product [Cyclocybe aegerita]|uniref:Uncharacterized protein n=1 Tax=Cyclocybe aegerita TaxID=1973307 RepID=A0A8S0VYM1_CYCAE|nr:unnamed protein product [Cyclocybe aegerita]
MRHLRHNSHLGHDLRLWRCLITYSISVLGLGTLAFIAQVVSVTRAIFHASDTLPPLGRIGAYSFVFVIWFAHGFMVWRCRNLYNDLNSRFGRATLFGLLASTVVLSLGCGIFFLVETYLTLRYFSFMFFICITAVISIILMILIIVRLVRHERYRSGVYSYDLEYKDAVSLLIESSALPVLVNIIFIALVFEKGDASMIPLHILPQSFVISVFLIISRLSRRKELASFHPSRIQLDIPRLNPPE